jgi:hypothetical protein
MLFGKGLATVTSHDLSPAYELKLLGEDAHT